MSSLPMGWARATVGDVACYINGLAFKPTDWEASGRPIIRIQNLSGSGADFNFTTKRVADDYVVRPGEILVSWSATLDAFKWSGPEAVLNQHIFRVLPNLEIVDPSLLFWGLKHVIREMKESEHLHGSTMKHINRGPFLAYSFALPPLNEQRRLVAKIEELTDRSRRAREALYAALALLGRFRQSVLAAAFRGDLTAGWRAKNPDSEPASVLLEQIRQERRRRWAEGLRAKGKDPKKAAYPESEPMDVEGLPELPDGWCWASLDSFCDVGTGATPSRSNPAYWEGGDIPWVTSGALNDFLVSSAAEAITAQALAETNVSIYPPGSLLVAMYGEGKTRGKVSELTFPSTTNQAIAALIFQGAALGVKDFIKFFLLRNYESMRRLAAGGVQPNLNLGIVRRIAVPLAPLAEQAQIVASLRGLLASVSQVEETLDRESTKLTALDHSILAKAFRGGLVPQDPNDEPASILLERIRGEAAEAVVPKARRGRKPKDLAKT